MPEQNEYLDKFLTEVKKEFSEVKADNKFTRCWLTWIGIIVLFGLGTIMLISIRISNSWMQQIVSIASKVILK